MIPADGTVAKADAEEQQLLQLKEQKGKKRKHVEAVDGAAGDDQPSDAAAGSKGKKPKGKAAARKGSEEAEAGNAGVADAAVDAADTATSSEAGAADDHASVAALKAQLVALAAENRQLKRQQKKEARLEKRAAAAAKRKEERAARRAAAAEAEAAKAAAAAEAAARVDVSAWKELQLYPAIEQAIAALGFEAPTHVQAECLPAAIRDRRDVIGAAQTGSGKTLAFGLPIMQLLLQERAAAGAAGSAAGGLAEGDAAAGADAAAKGVPAPQQPSKLRALILAPTRELALQVCDHLQARGPGAAACKDPECCTEAVHRCCERIGKRNSAPRLLHVQLALCSHHGCVLRLSRASPLHQSGSSPLALCAWLVGCTHSWVPPPDADAAAPPPTPKPNPWPSLRRRWARRAGCGWCPLWAASRRSSRSACCQSTLR